MKTIQLHIASLALAVAGWLVATAGALVNAAEPAPSEAKLPAPATTAGHSTAAARPARDWYPFRGEISTVDATGAALRLKRQSGERVVKVGANSELLRDGH